MQFTDLKYAVKSICDQYGFTFTEEPFEWFWRFENEYRIIDIHFNKKIQNGLFEQVQDSSLKLSKKNKPPYKASVKWYRDLGLLELEFLIVQLAGDLKQSKKEPPYGYCTCGEEFVKRFSSKNKQHFLGCSDYPRCTNTKKL